MMQTNKFQCDKAKSEFQESQHHNLKNQPNSRQSIDGNIWFCKLMWSITSKHLTKKKLQIDTRPGLQWCSNKCVSVSCNSKCWRPLFPGTYKLLSAGHFIVALKQDDSFSPCLVYAKPPAFSHFQRGIFLNRFCWLGGISILRDLIFAPLVAHCDEALSSLLMWCTHLLYHNPPSHFYHLARYQWLIPN